MRRRGGKASKPQASQLDLFRVDATRLCAMRATSAPLWAGPRAAPADTAQCSPHYSAIMLSTPSGLWRQILNTGRGWQLSISAYQTSCQADFTVHYGEFTAAATFRCGTWRAFIGKRPCGASNQRRARGFRAKWCCMISETDTRCSQDLPSAFLPQSSASGTPSSASTDGQGRRG